MHTSGEDFCGCRPVLRVENVAHSIAHYVEVLGFRLGWAWSDELQRFLQSAETYEPTFALVGRGQVQLMLSKQSQGAPGMWLHLDLQSAEKLDECYATWKSRGANILEPPALRAWGTYEMRVQDLDGHVLRVSAPPRSTGS